jgi:hypothetical protein
LFCSAFSKAEAQRLERKNGIFFLQSFFFCAYGFKRKSVYQVLIAKDSLPFVTIFTISKGDVKNEIKKSFNHIHRWNDRNEAHGEWLQACS